MIGGQRQLIPAPGGSPVDGSEIALTRVSSGILDGTPGFVGELAEVDLEGVGGRCQHPDIGPGAEHSVFQRTDHDRADLWMLETKSPNRVGKLDVHGEVVGVQLQLVVVAQPAVGIDVHVEMGDTAIYSQPPMAIPRGMGLKVDHTRTLGRLPPLLCPGSEPGACGQLAEVR